MSGTARPKSRLLAALRAASHLAAPTMLAAVLTLGLACRANPALTFDATELDTIAQFVARHVEAMRADGARMIETGRAHNDAHVIADGQHQITDAAALMQLQSQIVAMAAEMERNPITSSRLNVERALANGRSLQAEGDALKAHGEAMVAHGNLMRDLSHQPGNDWMLEGAEAMLRDSLQLAQIAQRLQEVGVAMVKFGLDSKRSIGG